MTNDLDPKLLEILAENITSSDGGFEYSDDINLLIGLQAIKENILSSPDFRNVQVQQRVHKYSGDPEKQRCLVKEKNSASTCSYFFPDILTFLFSGSFTFLFLPL